MEAAIKQDVAGFDISVYDRWVDRVEVGKSIGCLHGDPETHRPCEDPFTSPVSMEVIRQSAIRHKLIHQQELLTVARGAAVEVNEILMTEA